MDTQPDDIDKIKSFYDTTYYKSAKSTGKISHHLKKLAAKIQIHPGQCVLDVGCGTGEWLLACAKRGATPYGLDLSEKAIALCKSTMPNGTFYAQAAETLPFEDGKFDIITCLGSLEHFVNPNAALAEIVRVAKPDAQILILVPNADFLTRRLGVFSGTYQIDAKEEVRTLESWQEMFEGAQLMVRERWRDLHVLSWSWIKLGKWYMTPLRLAQALALAIWPMKWQYQVYHLCCVKQRGTSAASATAA